MLDELLAAYRGAADPVRAAAMAAYMKDRFAFFGIPTPQRRAIDRTVRPRSLLTYDELAATARGAWAVPEREPQYFACDELRRHERVLPPSSIELLEGLIATKSWWDTVDALAHTVGQLVLAEPALRSEMDRWLASEDLWLNRAAILHQLNWKQRTDADWLAAACLRHASDPRFFLRKAIGWALREHSKVDPAWVRRFVADHDGELSALSKREALKRVEGRSPPAADM